MRLAETKSPMTEARDIYQNFQDILPIMSGQNPGFFEIASNHPKFQWFLTDLAKLLPGTIGKKATFSAPSILQGIGLTYVSLGQFSIIGMGKLDLSLVERGGEAQMALDLQEVTSVTAYPETNRLKIELHFGKGKATLVL